MWLPTLIQGGPTSRVNPLWRSRLRHCAKVPVGMRVIDATSSGVNHRSNVIGRPSSTEAINLLLVLMLVFRPLPALPIRATSDVSGRPTSSNQIQNKQTKTHTPLAFRIHPRKKRPSSPVFRGTRPRPGAAEMVSAGLGVSVAGVALQASLHADVVDVSDVLNGDVDVEGAAVKVGCEGPDRAARC